MNVLTGVNYIIIEIKIQDIYFLTLTMVLLIDKISKKIVAPRAIWKLLFLLP